MSKIFNLLIVLLVFSFSSVAVSKSNQYMAFQKLALYFHESENKYYLAVNSVDDSTSIKNIDIDNLHIRLKTKDNKTIDIDRKDLIVIPLGDMYSKADAQYTFFQFNLVVDTSASITDPDLRKIESILDRFITRIPTPFKAQIVKFSDTVNKTSFSKDKAQIKKWISQPHERQKTALYDAISTAVEELKFVGKDVPLRFSIIFTDGQDTASQRYRDESSFKNHIIPLSKDNSIPLFIVGVGGVNVDLLRTVSQFGHFQHVQNIPDVDKFFDFIEEIIRGTYIFKIPAVSSLDDIETIYIMEKLMSGKFKTIQDISIK